jgi:ATP-binding cassette subfamily B protein
MNIKGGRGKAKKGTMKRLLGNLWKDYNVLIILVVLCIIINAVGSVSASFFLGRVTSIVEEAVNTVKTTSSIPAEGLYESVRGSLMMLLIVMGSIYLVALIANTIFGQIMAVITQGFLDKIRTKMFSKMEKLPISYFDRNLRGDIMSTYTNDVYAIRQLISQAIPQVISTILTAALLLGVMLINSLYLTVVTLIGVFFIFFTTVKVGGGSAKYFMRQQQAVAKEEGFIEEMMHGQKVVKVFTHEEQAIEDFNKLNEQLFDDMYKANAYANVLAPIIHNIGNILYVVIAIIGTIMCIYQPFNNLTITGFSAWTAASVVAFLTAARQFANNFNQVSQQINSVVMALAGASRVFDLIDQEEEKDEGYVTLVNAKINEDGTIEETTERTGHWAWKHPHSDGTLTYTELKGDIRLSDVDFGYVPDKIVLHNISIFAKPGQKIAFVGATGAGKTTITNLITRFYDLADGKVRYDGININKIKKADLRRSIGMVLQDTSLFTGTVKENIRYGNLDASDEDIIKAAKIANAHDFITRLPQGYDTMLTNDGSNLSQGQRQLLSIARAALADAPVLILDEATSSIDTHTEQLVTVGMDQLMEGRTVFVIAHRLSTIQNSNAIMVLDHGSIIERGDHEDLIKAKGTYYQLYTGAFELE